MIKVSQREQRFSVRVTHPPGKYLLCRKSRYNVGSWDVLAGESHWGLSLPVALPHRSRPLSLKQITTEKAWRCLRFEDSKPLFGCQEDEKRFLKNATQWSFASQVKGGELRIWSLFLSHTHAFVSIQLLRNYQRNYWSSPDCAHWKRPWSPLCKLPVSHKYSRTKRSWLGVWECQHPLSRKSQQNTDLTRKVF